MSKKRPFVASVCLAARFAAGEPSFILEDERWLSFCRPPFLAQASLIWHITLESENTGTLNLLGRDQPAVPTWAAVARRSRSAHLSFRPNRRVSYLLSRRQRCRRSQTPVIVRDPQLSVQSARKKPSNRIMASPYGSTPPFREQRNSSVRDRICRAEHPLHRFRQYMRSW